MDKSFYTKKLVSIGIPFSLSGEVDTDILPERALCEAAPIFYSSFKACSLTMTMLMANYSLFIDDVLASEILKIRDPLASAMLGGLLFKANPAHFIKSIESCRRMSSGFNIDLLDRSMHFLADAGRFPYDKDFESLFGIKICEVDVCDPKKTTPKEHMPYKNSHFLKRFEG